MVEGTQYQDSNASILSVNTIFNGKCYVWTALIKGQKNDPKAIFYVQVPNNKWVFYRQFSSELFALKQESRILGHSSNPVCGFSMKEQV